MQEEFYVRQIAEKKVLSPTLDVLAKTLPRDNLLASASLELFEFIKKECIRDLIKHLVENDREKLVDLNFMPTFRDIILRYDQTQGFTVNMESFMEEGEEMGRRPPQSMRLMDQISVDPQEEDYLETSDPEDDDHENHESHHEAAKEGETNGDTPASSSSKSLVDYSSDEEGDEKPEEETAEAKAEETPEDEKDDQMNSNAENEDPEQAKPSPPERLSEKRRREEDEDEDELGKLMANKRRNSSSSEANSISSTKLGQRRRSFTAGSGNGTPKRMSISLSPAVTSGGNSRSDEES